MKMHLDSARDVRPRRRDLHANLIEHAYADGIALARALASAVACDLRDAILTRGIGLLALSGGTTPQRFLIELGRQRLDWGRVVVTLADERWVKPDDARSNARLLRETLFAGAAAAARFEPLFEPAYHPDAALPRIARRIDALPLPFDAVVLGMGGDGHTASLFPGGDTLAQALDPHGRQRVVLLHAPAAPEPRITLTLPTLLATTALYLHIEGDAKRAVLAKALDAYTRNEDMPIRAIVNCAGEPLRMYWCA
ncbi:6-phosphogluconolactonase [Tahibacter aquaticus]|uniref:6-phosphogluconolactonase n=1 Tax=Tahibacter aquaticus TaxID=520092 RepID=A0A4R6YVJ8_9GAMM|nr:6-phosphogluconolactonase [Tahibacter aquaticus]TDR42618.1 6-phosphogluconolactonase [Tahibacter aquaticus]